MQARRVVSTCTTSCDTLRSNAPTLPMRDPEQTLDAAPWHNLPRLDGGDLLASTGRRAARASLWAVDSGEIRAMTTFQVWVALASGDIGSDARVWREGMECWLEALEVPELACAMPAHSGVRGINELDEAAGDGGEVDAATPYLPTALCAEPPDCSSPDADEVTQTLPVPVLDPPRRPAWVDDPRATGVRTSQRPPARRRGSPKALAGVAAVASLTLLVSALAARPRPKRDAAQLEAAAASIGDAPDLAPVRMLGKNHAEVGQKRLRAGHHR